MTQSYNEAVTDIKNYMASGGGSYNNWCVGVTASPKDRLFTDHGVEEKNDYWIYRQCDSSDTARKVEDYFVNTLGTKGDIGGGDESADYVYAYKITNHSRE